MARPRGRSYYQQQNGLPTTQAGRIWNEVEQDPAPKSFNLQTYIDVRIIAGLHDYFVQHGLVIEPKYSSLAEKALRIFHDFLVEQGQLEAFKSAHEAVEVLTEAGYSTSQFRDQRRNLRHNIQLQQESAISGLGSLINRERNQVIQQMQETRFYSEAPQDDYLYLMDLVEKAELLERETQLPMNTLMKEASRVFYEIRTLKERGKPYVIPEEFTRAGFERRAGERNKTATKEQPQSAQLFNHGPKEGYMQQLSKLPADFNQLDDITKEQILAQIEKEQKLIEQDENPIPEHLRK